MRRPRASAVQHLHTAIVKYRYAGGLPELAASLDLDGVWYWLDEIGIVKAYQRMMFDFCDSQ